MREFELLIDEALRNGLSYDESLPFNSQVLLNCRGFELDDGGIKEYKEKVNPLTIDLSYNWPFPQVLVGEKYKILVSYNRVDKIFYIYDISDLDNVKLIKEVDEQTYGNGGLFSLADFGKYAILINEAVIIYFDYVTNTWSLTDNSYKIPRLSTICNFKGQLVGGGVKSPWHGCDETFYVWSKIGEADFTPDRTNEAGFRRCPFGGEVFHTKRLADYVAGYSSGGISLLFPNQEPATFGFKELIDIGIINKGAVNGSLWEHVFVDTNYNIWKITADGVKKLGYQYYMRQLTGQIIVSYDNLNRQYYITDGSICFLLTDKGLTEILQTPSAVWSYGDETYCVPDSVVDKDYLITTWPFNFGYNGLKTNVSVEVGTDNLEGKVFVDYLTNNQWKSTDEVTLNREKIARIIVYGNAFRYNIKAESLEDTTISHIIARYKMSDLRGIRGIYAPPIRGQRNA